MVDGYAFGDDRLTASEKKAIPIGDTDQPVYK